jgi:hypothetical protein
MSMPGAGSTSVKFFNPRGSSANANNDVLTGTRMTVTLNIWPFSPSLADAMGTPLKLRKRWISRNYTLCAPSQRLIRHNLSGRKWVDGRPVAKAEQYWDRLARSVGPLSRNLAERAGFEPAKRGYRLLAFQASAFDHSATSPNNSYATRSSSVEHSSAR